MPKYGLDEYGRYYEDQTGLRFAIEPWPFGGWAPWQLRNRVTHRWWILKWHFARVLQWFAQPAWTPRADGREAGDGSNPACTCCFPEDGLCGVCMSEIDHAATDHNP